MTKITLPLHYTLMAVYLKFRTTHPLYVTEAAEFEVRDLEEGDAPVVASVETKWRLPIPGIDHARPRANSEEFAIRTFNGSFYVPVRKYTKNDLTKWSPVTSDGFPDLHSKKEVAVTPFEVPVQKSQSYPTNPIIGTRTASTFDGIHNQYDAFKVRKINNPEVRDQTLIGTAKSVERFAFINGELWQATKNEPVLQYRTMSNDSVFIDVVDAVGDDLSNCGYFRLNRLDDCRDFINYAYPYKKIATHIKDLQINDNDAFQYKDDSEALKRTAEEVKLSLAIFAESVRQDIGMRVHQKTITELLQTFEAGADNGNEIADVLSDIARDLNGKYNLDSDAIKAVVDRWNLRPVENAMGMRR